MASRKEVKKNEICDKSFFRPDKNLKVLLQLSRSSKMSKNGKCQFFLPAKVADFCKSSKFGRKFFFQKRKFFFHNKIGSKGAYFWLKLLVQKGSTRAKMGRSFHFDHFQPFNPTLNPTFLRKAFSPFRNLVICTFWCFLLLPLIFQIFELF